MNLVHYLKPENIAVGVTANSKEELLSKMVDLAATNPHVLDKEKVRAAIFERERIMSTGVGKGFAIPHGKTDSVSDIVLAFATTSEPVDYAALDNEPVRLILLLVSRDSDVGSRLKLLSRASKVMNSDSARTALTEATTAEQILEIFTREEERISD